MNLSHNPIFVAIVGIFIAAALLYFASIYGLRALLEAIESSFQYHAADHRQIEQESHVPTKRPAPSPICEELPKQFYVSLN